MTQQKPPESTNNNSEKKPELQSNTSPLLPSAAKSRYEKKRSPLHRFWNWAGFKEKKLWDVLQLLIVPTALAIGAFYLQETSKQRDLEIAQANREKDQQIADDRAKQETLNRYFDQISTLLFERKLRMAKEGDEARIVARARTLTVLRDLDTRRNRQLINFLREAKLLEKSKPIIALESADLKSAELEESDLSWVNLSRSNLFDAKLNKAKLTNTNLSEVDLSWADLSGADLSGANLREANLRGAFLLKAKLDLKALKYVNLCKTTMPDGIKSDRDCDKLKPKK